jgi:hypothetical protein
MSSAIRPAKHDIPTGRQLPAGFGQPPFLFVSRILGNPKQKNSAGQGIIFFRLNVAQIKTRPVG